jgi:hypothetical protein
VVNPYRRIDTNCRPPSASIKIGPVRCPEASVRNYHCTQRKDPEERRSHLLRGESLKSRSLSPGCPAPISLSSFPSIRLQTAHRISPGTTPQYKTDIMHYVTSLPATSASSVSSNKHQRYCDLHMTVHVSRFRIYALMNHRHHHHLALQPFVGFRLLSQVSPKFFYP